MSIFRIACTIAIFRNPGRNGLRAISKSNNPTLSPAAPRSTDREWEAADLAHEMAGAPSEVAFDWDDSGALKRLEALEYFSEWMPRRSRSRRQFRATQPTLPAASGSTTRRLARATRLRSVAAATNLGAPSGDGSSTQAKEYRHDQARQSFRCHPGGQDLSVQRDCRPSAVPHLRTSASSFRQPMFRNECRQAYGPHRPYACLACPRPGHARHPWVER